MDDRTVVSRILGRITEAARRLEQAGLGYGDWQQVIDDPVKRLGVVWYWHSGVAPTPKMLQAQELFGPRFLGPLQVANWLGKSYTPQQVQELGDIPFSLDLLQATHDSHILAAGYPVYLWEILPNSHRELYHRVHHPQKITYARGTDHLPAYFKTPTPLRWYLVPQDPEYVIGYPIVHKSDSGRARYRSLIKLLPQDQTTLEIWELYYLWELYYHTIFPLKQNPRENPDYVGLPRYLSKSYLFSATVDDEGKHLVLESNNDPLIKPIFDFAPRAPVALGYAYTSA